MGGVSPSLQSADGIRSFYLNAFHQALPNSMSGTSSGGIIAAREPLARMMIRRSTTSPALSCSSRWSPVSESWEPVFCIDVFRRQYDRKGLFRRLDRSLWPYTEKRSFRLRRQPEGVENRSGKFPMSMRKPGVISVYKVPSRVWSRPIHWTASPPASLFSRRIL